MQKKQWSGIPTEYTDRWREIYNNVTPGEEMHLSTACPVCGDTELYRYYSLVKTQPCLLGGIMYKGPGSYWEWCGSCRSYEHMSGYVPISWAVELSGIDHSKLTAIPDMIDTAMRKDKYIS
ncbi:hypothetical protein [Escherichia albertii]|uniref:hypothetical protein n=1 Tax=Escherichia albertii TaxID=208962 RepID=UPI0009316954|nr:hypothetical protein [Escherichia albertii]MCZ8804436.1 hypothetical protein [Escherichia albertii]MCZ8968852.1 hypothetical protein [Escherichia albertii]QTA24665.1 hypothetical protein FYK17_01405 [Escherichia albertii]